MKKTAVIFFSVSVILIGCGPKDADSQATPKSVAKKPKDGTPPSTTDAPVTPDTAPPPASAVPAATPDAAPGGSADSATSTGNGDVLARFRQGENGKILTDVEALQAVCDLYSRKAGISEGEGIPIPPSLKGNDLSLLVKFKYLTALPTPPEGQKFVMDQKTMKVKLVSK